MSEPIQKAWVVKWLANPFRTELKFCLTEGSAKKFKEELEAAYRLVRSSDDHFIEIEEVT